MPKRWKKIAAPLFRTWRWFGKVAAVLLLVGIAILVISWIGFTRDIDTTLEACAVTEDGEIMTCPVYIKGEMNLYPLRHEQDYFYTSPIGTGVRGITVNGKPCVGELYFDDDHRELAVGVSNRGVFCMDREGTVMFAEMDAGYIFPELGSKRCIVIAPASSEAEAKQLLAGQTIPEYHREKFDWLLEKS